MNQATKTTEINVRRTIAASPDEVYEAWLDYTRPGSPWHGVGKAIVNPPKVDGLFYSMYQLEGREIAHYGRFTTLDKPSKIQHTWVSEATHGMESIVTLSFEPVEGKTQVLVNHSNVPDDEGGRFHENAWKYVLAKMASRFSPEESE
jgi:activator of HSP90 ATPase